MAQVECPRCRLKIDPRATRCRHCQADFTAGDLASIRQADESKRNGVIAIVGIAVLIAMLSQCGSDDPQNGLAATSDSSSKDPEQATATDTPTAPSEPPSKWSYSRTKDELRNGEIVEATIRSENSTDLDFPYGVVHLNMIVRSHPEWGRDVIFRVDEGQILCGYQDCSGKINFDGRPETLSLNESGDNNSSVVFAAYAPSIIKKLQASDKVIVELAFYQNGNRQFTFDTSGLEWPPKKPAAMPVVTGKDPDCDPALAKSVGLTCE